MRYDTEKIRSANPLSDWLDRYGVEVDRKGFAKCPFHSEKTASFRVYTDGTYHCFGCGAHGDVITFVMNIQNLSFEDACRLLDRDISYSEQRKIDRIRRDRKSKTDKRKAARNKKHKYLLVEQPSGWDGILSHDYPNNYSEKSFWGTLHRLEVDYGLRIKFVSRENMALEIYTICKYVLDSEIAR